MVNIKSSLNLIVFYSSPPKLFC